jgi:hypothetical protein
MKPIDNVLHDENNICMRLMNDSNTIAIDDEQIIVNHSTDRMSRRERKMHERWSTSSDNDRQQSNVSTKQIFLGIEFPPIAVLRRKFSSKAINNNVSTTNEVCYQLTIIFFLFAFQSSCKSYVS